MALDAEILGPLEEIEFWCSRTVDLSGIGEQLNREDVKRVTCVLKASESSYLGPFVTLSQRIQEGCTEAISNLKFLESLKVPCQVLLNFPFTFGTVHEWTDRPPFPDGPSEYCCCHTS